MTEAEAQQRTQAQIDQAIDLASDEEEDRLASLNLEAMQLEADLSSLKAKLQQVMVTKTAFLTGLLQKYRGQIEAAEAEGSE